MYKKYKADLEDIDLLDDIDISDINMEYLNNILWDNLNDASLSDKFKTDLINHDISGGYLKNNYEHVISSNRHLRSDNIRSISLDMADFTYSYKKILKIIRNIYTQQKTIQEIVKDIIHYRDKKNETQSNIKYETYLQANKTQVFLLKLVKRKYNITNMTLNQFIEMFSLNDLRFIQSTSNCKKITLYNKDSVGLYNRDPNEILDLVQRCYSIVNYIIQNPNINNLVLLDGHGRTIALIVYLLQSLSSRMEQRNLDIIIFEIDEITHEWHTEFFPTNRELIGSFNVQLVNFYNDILDPSIINTDTLRNNDTLIYYNFCAIDLNLLQVIEMLFSNIQNIDFLVFFSLTANRRAEETARRFSRIISKFYRKLITDRADFLTFVISNSSVEDICTNYNIYGNIIQLNEKYLIPKYSQIKFNFSKKKFSKKKKVSKSFSKF